MNTMAWAALGLGGVAGALLAILWRRLALNQPGGSPAAAKHQPHGADPTSYQSALESAVIERTQALQAALRACEDSDRFLRSIADKLPNFVSYWDLNEVCHFANQGYLDLFGVSWDELRRTPWSQLIVPDQVEANNQRVAAVYAGQVQQYERVREFKGCTVQLWVQMVPDMADGQVRGFFVIATDVTPMKQVEHRLHLLNEQLIQARDRAETANRAKSAFLANMSHEIRTPLNGVLGAVEMLRHTSLDAVQEEWTETIADSGNHLLGVIQDVLDYSKIEAGEMALEARSFALAPLFRSAHALFGAKAREKSLEFRLSAGQGSPLVVGDEVRLRQVVFNLLSNAIKFTGSGSVALVVDWRVDDGICQMDVEVRDTGIGMDEAAMATVFERFSQGDSSTTRRFGGTGLGLSISRQLLRLMGSSLEVRSALGEGTAFRFRLELPQASGEETHEREAMQAQGAVLSGRVLLAEDNLTNQRVATGILQRLGLEVTIAGNGRETLALLEREDFQLVLMDCQMPELDGFQACRTLRSWKGLDGVRGRSAELPVVALTANATAQTRTECEDAGMDDFLPKPFRVAALRGILERWLGA